LIIRDLYINLTDQFYGGTLIAINWHNDHFLKLLDDDSPEIQKIIRSTLLNNSLEIILNGFIYGLQLDEHNFSLLQKHLEDIHFDLVKKAFQDFLNSQLEDIDLEKAMMIMAYWNNPLVKVPEVVSRLDQMSEEIARNFPVSGHPLSFFDHINFYLFNKYNFQGNSADFYNPDNSFIDKVLENGQGIPITLSALYIFIAGRLGLQMSGIPMPAHFIVKYQADNDEIFLDPFFAGKIYSREECLQYLDQTKIEDKDQILEGCSNYEMILRMMRNIYLVYSSYKENPQKTAEIEVLMGMLEGHFK
jgi:regulator of sirC expression with transglutaminase-like and TPR domain